MDKNDEEITDYTDFNVDEYEFEITTVDDLIRKKIPPSKFFPLENFRINMSWTEMIKEINEKRKNGKRINTQIPPGILIQVFQRWSTKSCFL